MLSFNVKRHGMPVSGSVATISASITRTRTHGEHSSLQFCFKITSSWVNILFHKKSRQVIHEGAQMPSGLWCRYLCTRRAFLVAQHFWQISQMDSTKICLDSMCWDSLCLILLLNPHSRHIHSPVKVLRIFPSTRHSRTSCWLPFAPRTDNAH